MVCETHLGNCGQFRFPELFEIRWVWSWSLESVVFIGPEVILKAGTCESFSYF